MEYIIYNTHLSVIVTAIIYYGHAVRCVVRERVVLVVVEDVKGRSAT